MLTAAQKTLVQNSFVTITPIAEDAALLFYQRLFELDPSLKRMFRGDMAEQRKKLMQMLTAAVKGLDRLEQLVPVVEELGRRHATYGVTEAHYDTVAAALLWTLEIGLGRAFTAEVREREALVRAIAGLAESWDSALEGHWRAAVTAIVVPMLEGAAVHTAMMAERLASDPSVSISDEVQSP
jgi:hemoglobin-like flavoprotein